MSVDVAGDLPPSFAALQHNFGEIGSGETFLLLEVLSNCVI